jgi:hypothetical protein
VTPAGVVALAFALTAIAFQRRGFGWREAIAFTGLVLAAFTAISTELLSAGAAIGFWSVLSCWIAFAVGAGWIAFGASRSARTGSPREPIDRASAVQIAALALSFAAIGVVALLSATSTDDALTYHMPRIVHWIQNRELGHYPTHVLRQLHMPPLAEIEVLHLQLLSSGDHLANLVQWGHAIALSVVASLIAKELGGDLRAQTFAAIFAGTIPAGILSASSAKNDLVLAYEIACLGWFAVMAQRSREIAWSTVVGAGVSLGLALDTKGTAYPFGAPFAGWIAALLIIRRRSGALKPLALLLLLGLLFPIGQYARNLETYGSIFGPSSEGDHGEFRFTNSTFGVATLLSNAVRNLAACMGTHESVAHAIALGVRALLGALAIDPDDPSTTYSFYSPFTVAHRPFHESLAPCALHLAAIFAALIAGTRRFARSTRLFAAALIAGYLLYSEVFRFQLWVVRLLVPLVAMFGAPVALAFARSRRLLLVAGWVLIAAAAPYAIFSETRALFDLGLAAEPVPTILQTPREEQYLLSFEPGVRHSYQAVAGALHERGFKNIGLVLDFQTAEYPIWVLLGQAAPDGAVRIEHVRVANPSARYAEVEPFSGFAPEVLVVADWLRDRALPEGSGWRPILRFGPFLMYVPMNSR